ncbi:hypothetical protein INT45_004811 [Circinella minor]|uniref:Uncharacterized protein n=1 Tax=Circinella minor TaxID=1195481 RepID=A0A8H7RTJ9_9FUNG|nr:hypothetical protein INT45_004811 [Circinella minor]
MKLLIIATTALCFVTMIQALPYNRSNDQFTKRDGGDNDDEKPSEPAKRPIDFEFYPNMILGKIFPPDKPKEEDD